MKKWRRNINNTNTEKKYIIIVAYFHTCNLVEYIMIDCVLFITLSTILQVLPFALEGNAFLFFPFWNKFSNEMI